MAKPPPVPRAVLQPPLVKKLKISTTADGTKKVSSVVTSKPSTSTADNMYTIREHNVSMHGVGQRGCLECQTSIERQGHFP